MSPSADLIVGDDGLARPAWASTDPLMRTYYDQEWGLPVGTYHVQVAGQSEAVEVTEGKVTEF